MKIPAILLFLLFWSIVSCNLADRHSGSGGQATLKRANDIERPEGSETSADRRHRRGVLTEGISNIQETLKGSKVNEEVSVLGITGSESSKSQKEGLPQLLRQKAPNIIAGDDTKAKKKKTAVGSVVPKAFAGSEEFAHDLVEAIGKVVLRHMLKKRISSIADNVPLLSREKGNDMVKNGIDRLKRVTSPLNNVPLISGESDDGTATKTGLKSLESAVAPIDKFRTLSGVGGRKEEEAVVIPLLPAKTADDAAESRKGLAAFTSNAERFSSKVGRRERAIAGNESAGRIRAHGSRKKRALRTARTYNAGQTSDSRLLQWPRASSELTTATHNSPITSNGATEWSRFTLANLLYGGKARDQSAETKTFQTYDWQKVAGEKSAETHPLRANQFSRQRTSVDRPSVKTFASDTGNLFHTDYTQNQLRINSYPLNTRKYIVARNEKQKTGLNSAASQVDNGQNQLVRGSKWNRRLLHQPQTVEAREQSNIGTQENKFSSQRTLYQSPRTYGILRTRNQENEGTTHNNRFQSTGTANKYGIRAVPTVASNVGKTKSTKADDNTVRFEHRGGSYDLGFSGRNFYVKPNVISRNTFLRKQHRAKESDDTSDASQQLYGASNYNLKQQKVAPTAATKIDRKQSGGKSSKVSSNTAKTNTYDAYLKKRIGADATKTNQRYRYNQAANSRGTDVEKVERNGLARKGFAAWNAQTANAQSDAAAHSDMPSRGVHFDGGRSTFSNAVRKQGGAREHGNPIPSAATKVIRYDRASADASPSAHVSKFSSQLDGATTANEFSKQWQQPRATKASFATAANANANANEETSNVRAAYRFARRKSQSTGNTRKKSASSSESSEFQLIPLVLTPMGTAAPWSRGHSTIKNQRIHYNPNVGVFNAHARKQATSKKSSKSGKGGASKSAPKQKTKATFGRKSNGNVQWRRNNAKSGGTTNKNRQQSVADASGEIYNRFPLILTAIPTSKSFTPIRGVKNKRISVEDVSTGFDDHHFEETEYGGEKIRKVPTKGNYGSSDATSKVINYGKVSRGSSSDETGEFYEASASGGMGSYEQSHEESAELSESHVATDKGGRITNFSDTTIDKGAEYGIATDQEETSSNLKPSSGSALHRDDGFRTGELSRRHQFSEISHPSAAAAAATSSSAASSNGFAKVPAYNGNTDKGSRSLKGSELLTTSSAGSEAQGASVGKETSRHKLGKLSGSGELEVDRTSHVRAGRIGDASVTSSMARGANEEEWWSAEWRFAYRKYMAAGHGEAESSRLAHRQLADKSSNVEGVQGSASETSRGTSSATAYSGGSTYSGAASKEASAESHGESSPHEFLVGKSAAGSSGILGGSTASGQAEDGGKTGRSFEASAEATSGNVRDPSSPPSKNDGSSSTDDTSSPTHHPWMHQMRKYGWNEKQRSSGINIAGGGRSADARAKFREENGEWLVGGSRNGWSRWTASEADDKGVAEAAKSALSDKSRAESSPYGKLASNGILGKSATEFSGVSGKSGANAGSGALGRYTEMLSDASLTDSTRVTNGIRGANAGKGAESVSLANSYGDGSIKRGIGSRAGTGETSSASARVLGVGQKNTAVKIGAADDESMNNAHAKQLGLSDELSRSSANAWPSGKNFKHGSTTSKLPSKSSEDLGAVDADVNVKGGSTNTANLNGVKGSDLFATSSSETFINAWPHADSLGQGLRSNQLLIKRARTLGTTKSNDAVENELDNTQKGNLAHVIELDPSSESPAFEIAGKHSGAKKSRLSPYKSSNLHTFGMTGASTSAESSTRNEIFSNKLGESSYESSGNAQSQSEVQQRDKFNLLLPKSSSSNAKTSANAKSEYSKHGKWSTRGSNKGWSRWWMSSESDAEESSDSYTKESIAGKSKIQGLSGKHTKQMEHEGLSKSGGQRENSHGGKIDAESAKESNEEISIKSSSSADAKADVEMLNFGSIKNDVEMIAPTKGGAKSGASHESLVSVKADNEIHDLKIPAKQSSASSLSAADASTYANARSSGVQHKWKSRSSTNEEIETFETAGSQAKSSAYGKFISSKFQPKTSKKDTIRSSTDKFVTNDIDKKSGKLNFNKYTMSHAPSKTDQISGAHDDDPKISNSVSSIKSFTPADARNVLSKAKSSGPSTFMELPKASVSSKASAGAEGTGEVILSQLVGQPGTHGEMYKQTLSPKSSSSALASANSKTELPELDRELSNGSSAVSAASGKGRSSWSVGGFASGEAPQAKQSLLSAKSRAHGSSVRAGGLDEFNSKKLTAEFAAASFRSRSNAADAGKSIAKSSRTVAGDGASDEIEFTSAAKSAGRGAARGMANKESDAGYNAKLFRDSDAEVGTAGSNGGIQYGDVLGKRVKASRLMESSILQRHDFERNESNIGHERGNAAESDSASAKAYGDAKIGGKVKNEGSEEETGSLFSKATSEVMSHAGIYGKGMSVKSSVAGANANAASSSIRSRTKGMESGKEGSNELHRGNLGKSLSKFWANADPNAEASSDAVEPNVKASRKWIYAGTDPIAQKKKIWSSTAADPNTKSTKHTSSGTSSRESHDDDETGAEDGEDFYALSPKSSATGSADARIKEDVEENVSLNESQMKAFADGAMGNDKLSGKKSAGKLIDATSQVVAGAGSQHPEFDGKDTGSVVSDVERARTSVRTKSMSSTERDSPSELSDKGTGNNELSDDKSGQDLSHSKLIEISPGKLISSEEISDSEASGEAILKRKHSSALAEAILRKKLFLTDSDAISDETRKLMQMRNKLLTGEDLLSSSLVKNKHDGVELIGRKWFKASGSILAKSKETDEPSDEFSMSIYKGTDSSETDPSVLIRATGKNRLRERGKIKELSEDTVATTATGNANSEIVSRNMGHDRSANSKLIPISKSSASGKAQVYATASGKAKTNSLETAAGESSAKSKASEADDMLSSSAESSVGSVTSNAKTAVELVGSEPSPESQTVQNRVSHKKESASLSAKDPSMKLADPSKSNYEKIQKLLMKPGETLASPSNKLQLDGPVDEIVDDEGGTDHEASDGKISKVNDRLSASASRIKLSATFSSPNAAAAAESHSKIRDRDRGKLGRKSAPASASSGKSTAHSDSSGVRKSSSYGRAGAFNMRAASESGDAFARDALLSDEAINGRRKFDGSAGTSSKSSGAIGGGGLSRGSAASIGNVRGDSVGELQASLAKQLLSNVGSDAANSDHKTNVSSGGRMSSSGKNGNAEGNLSDEMGGEWEEGKGWKKNQKRFMERLTKKLLHSSGWKANEAGGEKGDEQTNEGLMFIAYDSFGRARLQQHGADENVHVAKSDDESSLGVVGSKNGVFDGKEARRGQIAEWLAHESADGSQPDGKSPHAAVIVPFSKSADWWSKNKIDASDERNDKLSLLKLLGRHEKDSLGSEDRSKEFYDKLMAAGLLDASGDTLSDSKYLQKGRRIELIPVTSTDSSHESEDHDNAVDGSNPGSKDKNSNDKKKCIQLYTVPPDETSDSSERGTQFIRGLSYEFEPPDSSSSAKNNDEDPDVSGQTKRDENSKKPYKICLDLDNSDAKSDEVTDNQRTEIFVVRWTSQGPVRVAQIEDKVKPVVIFKLLSRHTYEKIRDLLAHK